MRRGLAIGISGGLLSTALQLVDASAHVGGGCCGS
ncbi:S-methylmethionine-dependent homocysteine/selenocysteine methylase [Longispora fulva]|uniref:S-methylmethionine-dependent homocysteine/selenocysteine methylase n=1 Tax=Longispora fulva TaxID=619741 RepID=A0A8J7KMR5_9ACTN|nr:S-methylmethionine-dependent homocysteine/selenocysteine methylase [Longispora fulva]